MVLTFLAVTRFKLRNVARPNHALSRASLNHSLDGKPKKGYGLL